MSPEVPTSASSSPSVTALHRPSSQVVCLLTTEEDGCLFSYLSLTAALHLRFLSSQLRSSCPALVNLLPGQYKTNYTLPGQYKTSYTLPTTGPKDSDINDGSQGHCPMREWGVLSSRLWQSSLSADPLFGE